MERSDKLTNLPSGLKYDLKSNSIEGAIGFESDPKYGPGVSVKALTGILDDKVAIG